MWWIVLVVICAVVGLYVALRLYINAVLVKEAKFKLIVDKLQRETEAIITEFNRITDRNVTVAEESAVKLNKLLQQSKMYLTQLSKKQPPTDDSLHIYSPQSVADNSAARSGRQTNEKTSAHDQIVGLLRRGISAEEIAARVGVSVSEVETVSVMLDT